MKKFNGKEVNDFIGKALVLIIIIVGVYKVTTYVTLYGFKLMYKISNAYKNFAKKLIEKIKCLVYRFRKINHLLEDNESYSNDEIDVE